MKSYGQQNFLRAVSWNIIGDSVSDSYAWTYNTQLKSRINQLTSLHMRFASIVVYVRTFTHIRQFILPYVTQILDSRQPQIESNTNVGVHWCEPKPFDTTNERFHLQKKKMQISFHMKSIIDVGAFHIVRTHEKLGGFKSVHEGGGEGSNSSQFCVYIHVNAMTKPTTSCHIFTKQFNANIDLQWNPCYSNL